jgi:hypothetical protein
MLYKIQSDTSNIYDVYLDPEENLWYAVIADNTFLILDNDFAINKDILNLFSIKLTSKTLANPFGLSFTLKTDTTVVLILTDVLFRLRYNAQVVTDISQLFMFVRTIDAEAVFTTPLYLLAQPQIVLNFGPYITSAATVVNPTSYNLAGDGSPSLIPWSKIVSQRGNPNDLQVVLSSQTETPPDSGLQGLDRGRITMKRPGVYMINGYIQLSGVSSPDNYQEIRLLLNKGGGLGDQSGNNFYQSCKLSGVKDGGLPFTFLVNITEEMINEVFTGKVKGEAYIQLNMYRSGSSSNVRYVNDNGRYHYCSITHLG